MSHRRLVLWTLLLAAGCSSMRVETHYEKGAAFSELRTFAWRETPPQASVERRLEQTPLGQRVRAAVERELAAKGYRQAAVGAPADFVVGYHAVLQPKVDVRTIGRMYGYRVRPPGLGTYEVEYDEGSLLIDVADPKTNDLLWRGSATAVIDRKASIEKREQRVDEAVAKILAKFPPN